MGSQEGDWFVRSLWCGDLTHGCVIIGIYNHRKDGFISDEIVTYAGELTKDIDA